MLVDDIAAYVNTYFDSCDTVVKHSLQISIAKFTVTISKEPINKVTHR